MTIKNGRTAVRRRVVTVGLTGKRITTAELEAKHG